MKECSKSIVRRLSEPNFTNKYFVGHGVDIGGRPDPLSLYTDLFIGMEKVDVWDLEDGDAQFMKGVEDNTYDFVHSSHTLEHINDPFEAVMNWLRILKHGGYLIVTIPDEDLYEQGIFPSTFNTDHKATFTIMKHESWSPRSINIFELIQNLGPTAEPVKIEQLNSTYRYNLPRYDQTVTPIGESCIEFIVRKRPNTEVEFGGQKMAKDSKVGSEMRIHFNQYRDDIATLKAANHSKPPFKNDGPL